MNELMFGGFRFSPRVIFNATRYSSYVMMIVLALCIPFELFTAYVGNGNCAELMLW
jgi:hypothetical protein